MSHWSSLHKRCTCVRLCQLRGLCSICHAFDPNSLKHLEQQFTPSKTRNRTQAPCVRAFIRSKIPEQNDTELNSKKKTTTATVITAKTTTYFEKRKWLMCKLNCNEKYTKRNKHSAPYQIVWCKWYISALHSLNFIIKETKAKSRTNAAHTIPNRNGHKWIRNRNKKLKRVLSSWWRASERERERIDRK